jgi:hypothetical protein
VIRGESVMIVEKLNSYWGVIQSFIMREISSLFLVKYKKAFKKVELNKIFTALMF